MEAFVALSAAVNVAQVIDYGLRLIQKSKELREQGVTDSAMNDDAQRLNNLATGLISQGSSKCNGNLRSLALECANVSKILISELEQLKPTDPESKMQRAKAILKRERKGRRIMELERRLQDHKSQLSLHLTSLSRIEFNEKLDEVSLDMQKMRSELAATHLMTKELSNSDHIGQTISRTLQPLVQHYYDRICQSSELAILDMLHFPDMHERFDTIPNAHKETLHWLLDPPKNAYWAREKAGKDFIAWLRQGSGFFHVSGKPGAGKSTLMKYICSHRNVDDHLGRGQFFFWKPGSLAQKSIKGLLRGLLYSVVDKTRNLISTAFPDLWESIFARASSSRHLEYRDFQQGFDNLLTYARDSGSYKFVFFIDGLDEFEGRHLDLIGTMKEWTEKYTLKICVSSCEYGVFIQSFSSYPKLRLHECNFVDIERMASARLKSIPLCADLEKSDEALQTIVYRIKQRADGVFIWVSVILAGIEDAIISGTDLPELQERIDAYPAELDDLYWHLVHLIHEADRKWAFRALKMVQFSRSHHDLLHGTFMGNISLLQFSFLDDIQYNATAGFPKISVVNPNTAAQRLDNMYKKVYGRCKGFLDVVERNDALVPRVMAQEVVFTHRSLVEFLETPSFAEKARPYICDFDCFINVCGSMLRCLEYQQPFPDVFSQEMREADFAYESTAPFWMSIIDIYLELAFRLRPVMPNMFLHCLEAFRDHIAELSRRVEDQPSIVYWNIQYFALIGLKYGVAEPWKHLWVACRPRSMHRSAGLPHLPRSQLQLYLLLSLRGLYYMENDIAKFMIGLFPQTWCPGTVIAWCLQHGADPDLTIGKLISDGPHSLEWPRSNNGWQVMWISSPKCSLEDITNRYEEEQLLVMNETSPLCQIVKGNGGVLKLLDLLSYWFPDDEYFPNLIDRLQSGKVEEHSDSTFPPTIVGRPPGEVVRRTWETDCMAYKLFDFCEALEIKGNREIGSDERIVFLRLAT
ncbi:hypothetical protein F4782DRAFT_531360 [Xylaria castorea]|nr:hypothetical protein F4782DRAFT_531360 [Xylaria castorea]